MASSDFHPLSRVLYHLDQLVMLSSEALIASTVANLERKVLLSLITSALREGNIGKLD